MTIPTQASDDISRLAGQFNIYSQLLRNRIVMLWDQVDDEIAKEITAQLLYLEGEDSEKDIWLYINSPGGSVTAGMAIYDTMQYVKSDIQTIVVGQACSMGSLLASAGTKGKRYMLPHARHMIHQPLGGASGQATDVEIRANELLRWKKELTEIYVKTTGQPLQKLKDDMERDKFMNAEEAVAYGLVDRIVTSRLEDDKNAEHTNSTTVNIS